MNQKVAQALNEQVIFEFNAASTYLALSLAMADANFKGFSAWLRAQYQEEVTHAFKFIDYLQSNNEKVTLGDVKNTASTLTNPLEVAKAVLDHEQMITGKIHNLYALALEEKDYATVSFLNWFVEEQVEEEANATDLVDQFTFAQDSRSAQLFLDSKLGSCQ